VALAWLVPHLRQNWRRRVPIDRLGRNAKRGATYYKSRPSQAGPGCIEPTIKIPAAADHNVCWLSPLTHSQRLKYRICRVSVKPRLELGEQLTGDGRDILDARHRQQ
jgi:hypothetical protein